MVNVSYRPKADILHSVLIHASFAATDFSWGVPDTQGRVLLTEGKFGSVKAWSDHPNP
jgi:hypothetical protein